MGCIAAWWQVNLQNPHIDFGFKNFECFRREGRRHQHLYKLLGDLKRSALVQRAVQSNNAAKR